LASLKHIGKAGNFMGNINIKLLAAELKLSVSTISKALMDSHEN
jgi:hypothetical protein